MVLAAKRTRSPRVPIRPRGAFDLLTLPDSLYFVSCYFCGNSEDLSVFATRLRIAAKPHMSLLVGFRLLYSVFLRFIY